MSNPDSAPDWIKPGTEVVVFQLGGTRPPASTAKVTTIERVVKQSFVTRGDDTRFRIRDQESKQFGGSWNGWRYRCIPVGSDEARQLLAQHQRLLAHSRARRACEQWIKTGAEDDRVAAVEALTKIAGFGPRPQESP